MPDFLLEQKIGGNVAGIDEAGRGSWAGPVIAAAVILDKRSYPSGIDDSKKLSAKKRALLFEQIQLHAFVGIGISGVDIIDSMNILNATKQAMFEAIGNLPVRPDYALIDGNQKLQLACPSEPIIKGDTISLSIAAASIIAKVTRDRLMRNLHRKFPYYGWDRNAGYGTREHIEAIEKYGITEHHRKSFAPIKEKLKELVLT